jgi:Na+/proline symporter
VQSYWQSAIAAKPSAAVKAFLLGGLVWFAIPFTLATSLGLAGVALGLELPEYKVRCLAFDPALVEVGFIIGDSMPDLGLL